MQTALIAIGIIIGSVWLLSFAVYAAVFIVAAVKAYKENQAFKKRLDKNINRD